MREHRYRAWDKEDKRMYHLSLSGMSYDGYGGVKLVFGDDFHDDSYSGRIDFELMEYTGRKDCKGDESYEGDIVRFQLDDPKWDRIGVIVYSFTEFVIRSLARKYPDVRLSDTTRIEIIGNIYQHPNFPGTKEH